MVRERRCACSREAVRSAINDASQLVLDVRAEGEYAGSSSGPPGHRGRRPSRACPGAVSVPIGLLRAKDGTLKKCRSSARRLRAGARYQGQSTDHLLHDRQQAAKRGSRSSISSITRTYGSTTARGSSGQSNRHADRNLTRRTLASAYLSRRSATATGSAVSKCQASTRSRREARRRVRTRGLEPGMLPPDPALWSRCSRVVLPSNNEQRAQHFPLLTILAALEPAASLLVLTRRTLSPRPRPVLGFRPGRSRARRRRAVASLGAEIRRAVRFRLVSLCGGHLLWK